MKEKTTQKIHEKLYLLWDNMNQSTESFMKYRSVTLPEKQGKLEADGQGKTK